MKESLHLCELTTRINNKKKSHTVNTRGSVTHYITLLEPVRGLPACPREVCYESSHVGGVFARFRWIGRLGESLFCSAV